MKKKLPMIISFALAAFIVIGQTGFAHGSDSGGGKDNSMNGHGMSNMMDAMHSSEGNSMIESCMNFMQSFDDDKKEE